MKNALTLIVTSVRHTARLLTVHATCSGRRYEFASYLGGPLEVYDHPRSWGGLARFVGYLPSETGRKLRACVAEQIRERGTIAQHAIREPAQFPVYTDRTWVRNPSAVAIDVESEGRAWA